MADPARAAKLAQRIKVVVAEALGRKVKDPRLEGITVTDARVTNDLQHATVYYTVFGDQAGPGRCGQGAGEGQGRPPAGSRPQHHRPADPDAGVRGRPDPGERLQPRRTPPGRRRSGTPKWPPWPASAQHAGDADPYKSDVPQDVEIDEDDFDEEDLRPRLTTKKSTKTGTANVVGSAPRAHAIMH